MSKADLWNPALRGHSLRTRILKVCLIEGLLYFVYNGLGQWSFSSNLWDKRNQETRQMDGSISSPGSKRVKGVTSCPFMGLSHSICLFEVHRRLRLFQENSPLIKCNPVGYRIWVLPQLVPFIY